VEERGFYEAALRALGLHGDANEEFDARDMILDEATAEAIDDLREDMCQMQLAMQQVNRKLETLTKRIAKLNEQIGDRKAVDALR